MPNIVTITEYTPEFVVKSLYRRGQYIILHD